MVMGLAFLALLFIAGLLHTSLRLMNFPIKKFITWFQSLSPKSKPTSTHHLRMNSTMAAVERVETTSTAAAGRDKAEELKSVFATFDKNNDGFITKQELMESVKSIGIQMTEREVAEAVEKVDFNGDGLIDLDEFCELFEAAVGCDGGVGGEEEVGDDLKEAFDVFDGDGDGLITVEELGLVLCSLGLMKEGKKVEKCKEMIRRVDVDGDGMVNFDEFKRMMIIKSSGGSLVAAA